MTLALQDFKSATVEPSVVDTDAALRAQQPQAASVPTWSWWTPERIEELKTRWAGGKSARVIGNALGTTRSAILGKVHRLKLPSRAIGEMRAKKVAKPRREKRPKRVAVPRPPPLVAVTSVITGNYITTRRMRPHIVEQTKTELRAMLTQAVLNTGGAII